MNIRITDFNLSTMVRVPKSSFLLVMCPCVAPHASKLFVRMMTQFVFKFAFYNVSKANKLDQAVFGKQPVRNQAGTLDILVVFFRLHS